REVLLDGKFHPSNPLTNYPMIEGLGDDKKITALFSDQVVSLSIEEQNNFDLLNAQRSERIILDVKGKSKKYRYTILDCLGEKVKNGTIELAKGTFAFEAPPSGLISFTITN
ncbi:MAG: hypothetical protein ACR2MX_19970, partial [Cyclobacteriaceae bacterium]